MESETSQLTYFMFIPDAINFILNNYNNYFYRPFVSFFSKPFIVISNFV